jgi:hypothetical protein
LNALDDFELLEGNDQPNGLVHGSAPKHSSEPSSPTSSSYAAERGSSSTTTSVSHVEDSISHEIEELNIHDPPPVSNDSDASWFICFQFVFMFLFICFLVPFMYCYQQCVMMLFVFSNLQLHNLY